MVTYVLFARASVVRYPNGEEDFNVMELVSIWLGTELRLDLLAQFC